ncbi:DUF262 domain-containing protein [Brachyspira intermedia]|uniref:DUF262 domain-containing protein n=1 Tax=Brachyspira intermedia TaxID=84377 RepID=UPI0030041D65
MNDKLSLIDFFKKYSRIEIPKIQRDYAQGRENESEVADRFLDKIFQCLKDITNLELDFIYGSVDKNVVYLLDGQQRVTTLFLLHWYIALKEDKYKEIECLKNFTYSTRVSSREFCQNIIDIDNVENIKQYYDEKSKDDDKVKLCNIIKDFYWFTNENDPTIKAMLNMIDKIDEKYNEITKDNSSIKLFYNLEKIQFYFLPLEDFKLTDEIYLKMNARGKPLTSFENFKADLTNYFIKSNENKIDSSIQQQLSDLDNKYTNFFWQLSEKYNKKNKQNNIILDDLYIKFFYRITLIYFIINYEESNEKLIDNKYYNKYLKNGSFEELNEKNKYSSFNVFEETYDENKNIIKIIFKVLDLLENEYNNNILNTIKPIWDQNDYDILSKIKYEYEDIIIFSALIFYIDKNNFKYNETSFKQWMRIVWNITENSYIDESSYISLIKLFYELSEHYSNIYNFLADDNNKIKSEISKEAVQYERRKCKFIVANNNWEKYFTEAEKHPFFKGYIDFLIDDNMDIGKFNHRKKMMYKVFGPNGTKEEFLENHLFLRALISKIDYFWDLSDNFKDTTESLKILIRYKEYYDYSSDGRYLMNNIIRYWFDNSKNKEELIKELEKSTKRNSEINIDNNEAFRERVKIAHEALYKEPDLQNWMQAKGAHNIKNDYGNFYVYRYRSPNDRVLIGSYRNKLIKYLISNYNCEDRNNYQLPYELQSGDKKKIEYFGCFEITIYYKDYNLNFDRWNQLTIKKGDKDFLKEEYRSLNNYTFKDYKDVLKREFFDKY